MSLIASDRADSRKTSASFEPVDTPTPNKRKRWQLFSFWKEDPVPDAATAKARALAGAAYLDRRFGPLWDERIDLERLAIHSPCRCIAGQLGQWRFIGISCDTAFRCGLSCGAIADCLVLFWRPPALARSNERLTVAWREVITDRRLDRAYRRRFTSQRPGGWNCADRWSRRQSSTKRF